MIRVQLDQYAKAPSRAHDTDGGIDLYAPTDYPTFYIRSGRAATINTGVHIEIPEGYVGLIKSRSGLNIHQDLVCEGVIDAGYSGAVVVKLYNHGREKRRICQGEKIAQIVIVPCLTEEVEVVDQICGGARGENGFGSSGRF